MIDNRHAPVPESLMEAARKAGKQVLGGKGVFECATITCVHCHAISLPMGFCRRCNHYLCDKPECNSGCRPLNALLDELQEAAARSMNLKHF